MKARSAAVARQAYSIALGVMLALQLGAVPVRGELSPRVAVVVGPVGEELTPIYIALAEAAAEAAETRGANVATVYSPDATAQNVLEAVEGASIVVYFGHGIGTPNPYSDSANPAVVNGWGLNGPRANGHADSTRDGSLAYYGEAWIAEHAKPAPGWVMIYSNACYAPGAGEGFDEPADEETAATRVAGYSRAPLADLGASAYFATDFYEGAAHLVAALLDNPTLPYGDIFASEPRFDPDGLVRLPHATVAGAEAWLHRSAYFEGRADYWYAFAGNPSMSLAGAVTASRAAVIVVDVNDAVDVRSATLTLPAPWTISPAAASVIACADRCAELAIASGPVAGPVISDFAAALLFDSGEDRTVSLQLPPRAVLLRPPAMQPSAEGPIEGGPTEPPPAPPDLPDPSERPSPTPVPQPPTPGPTASPSAPTPAPTLNPTIRATPTPGPSGAAHPSDGPEPPPASTAQPSDLPSP